MQIHYHRNEPSPQEETHTNSWGKNTRHVQTGRVKTYLPLRILLRLKGKNSHLIA